MPDPTDEAKPTTGSDATNAAPGVSVNWRGIVDDDAPQPKSVRFVHFLGRSITAVLVGLGLKRKRRPDGTLAPRPWGRVIAIWGGAFALLLLLSSGHIIAAGNAGVPVTLGDAGQPLDSGMHFTLPWPFTRVAQMSTRTQNYTMTSTKGEGQLGATDDSITVLGSDGATAQVDATVLYSVALENATNVYENVGSDFTAAIIRPSARACVRTEFTKRDLVSASTRDWPEIANNIAACMREKIEPRGITMEDFQLRDVKLSPQVQQAIEARVAAKQTGDAQLSNAYLQFAYIQALRSFADSDSNVTLVVPNGGSGDGGVQPVLPVTPSSTP